MNKQLAKLLTILIVSTALQAMNAGSNQSSAASRPVDPLYALFEEHVEKVATENPSQTVLGEALALCQKTTPHISAKLQLLCCLVIKRYEPAYKVALATARNVLTNNTFKCDPRTFASHLNGVWASSEVAWAGRILERYCDNLAIEAETEAKLRGLSDKDAQSLLTEKVNQKLSHNEKEIVIAVMNSFELQSTSKR